MGIFHFCCFLLLTMFSSYVFAAITRSNPLTIRQSLSSPDGSYELGFFSPNSSQNHQYVGIWFKRVTPQVSVWVANRANPVTTPTANLTISINGSLVLLDEKQEAVWSSGGEAFTSNKCHAELLNTGNLVIVDNVTGTYLWQSFDHLSDTMLPLSSLMYDIPNNTRRVLTSWKSNTDPSPGEFVAELTPDVPPQGLTWKGSSRYWRSGPWAESRFVGIIEMDGTYVNPLTLVQDLVNGTGVLTFCALRNFDVSYIKLSSNGSLNIHRSNGGTTGWIKHFEGPISSCDLYGTCGPYGLCIRSISTPTCKCLKGFVPKSNDEWNRGNWTRGCVRRTELSTCLGNSSSTTQGKDTTDGFYRVANIKPPDSYKLASFDDAEECHQGCLRNCSCSAFAYVNGIGCLVWNKELLDMVQFTDGGEILSIRLARSELARSKRIKIIAVTAISLSVFIILVAFGCWIYRVKQKGKARVAVELSEESWKSDLRSQDVSGLNLFEMHTIQTATDNFSVSNKLGQGGFGTVYKGKLEDGKEIAIKRLSSSSVEGAEEFMNELKLISELQHRNLVRLLGYCFEGEEKLLIYEYMVNKSLDTFLFDLKKKLEIDWPKRFNIIQGIARGLIYLHRDSFLKVIHRDLKASNILLDEQMNPKISDFGLARMFQGTQNQDNTGGVFGTLGYMSPEYAWTGTFSEKSDIYSFGVLILEIISGREISNFTYEKEDKNLLAYAWESWSESREVDVLDKEIDVSVNSVEEVKRCVQIGLLCVQHQANDRPNIKQVVSMLTSTMDLPKPKQPMFVLDNSDEDSLSLKSSDHKDLFSDDENKHAK